MLMTMIPFTVAVLTGNEQGMTMDDATLSGTVEEPSSSSADLEFDFDLGDPNLFLDFDAKSVAKGAVIQALAGASMLQGVALELSVRIVSDTESRALNGQYRSIDKPTNVLSFPAHDPTEILEAYDWAQNGGPQVLLGDLVMASGVISKEASEQGKSLHDHYYHLIVHGVLHLLGYDHIDDTDAEHMENLERNILAEIGIADPYNIRTEK